MRYVMRDPNNWHHRHRHCRMPHTVAVATVFDSLPTQTHRYRLILCQIVAKIIKIFGRIAHNYTVDVCERCVCVHRCVSKMEDALVESELVLSEVLHRVIGCRFFISIIHSQWRLNLHIRFKRKWHALGWHWPLLSLL